MAQRIKLEVQYVTRPPGRDPTCRPAVPQGNHGFRIRGSDGKVYVHPNQIGWFWTKNQAMDAARLVLAKAQQIAKAAPTQAKGGPSSVLTA